MSSAPVLLTEPPRASLSPSRAADFMTCPLLYRLRVIDRLPEPSSPAAVRGTLVHRVLEDMLGLDPAQRTLPGAQAMVAPIWSELLAADPELGDLFDADDALSDWLDSARGLLSAYFRLEDPTTVESRERELAISVTLDDGIVLRGIIDRVDVGAAGVCVVDYKTGKAPPPDFEARALFQMRFYALALWRSTGELPKTLRLLYLGSNESLTLEPDETDLLATERKIRALIAAILRAHDSGNWRPRKSGICGSCAHQALCPEFGGTPPPLPERTAQLPAAAVEEEVAALGLG